MPRSKSGSNLRELNQRQRDLARAEYLRHPDSSISQVAKATGVGIRTVARAREALVREGLLPQGRNAETGAELAAITHAVRRKPIRPERTGANDPSQRASEGANDPIVPAAPDDKRTASAASPSAPSTVDGEALRTMNQMLDDLADEDDDVTRKRMLKQFKRFAFDPLLHPETRMQASQGWTKLHEMARQKDLGPGKPLTYEAARARGIDFFKALGLKLATDCFLSAFPELTPPASEA